jgi:hypothetical protein
VAYTRSQRMVVQLGPKRLDQPLWFELIAEGFDYLELIGRTGAQRSSARRRQATAPISCAHPCASLAAQTWT